MLKAYKPIRSISFALRKNLKMDLFNGDNKFDPNTDLPDLSGKVFVVTGGTAGIGFGISAHLLQHGASKIHVLGKKEEHIEEAQEGLLKYGPVPKVVEFHRCELEDLRHTDQVAKELAGKIDRLDGLILNAGLGVGLYGQTADGIENHIQVNHISQQHLALTLLPQLLKTANSRLVVQSSDLHRLANESTKFANVEELNTDLGPAKLYNRSKLAQVLFVKALVQRLERGEFGAEAEKFKLSGPWINATHPGAVSTDQQEQAVEAYGAAGKVGVKLVRPFMKEPLDQGCRPALWAATSEEVEKRGVQGKYIVPDKKVTEASKQGNDHTLSESLWSLTNTIITEKLGKPDYMEKFTA